MEPRSIRIPAPRVGRSTLPRRRPPRDPSSTPARVLLAMAILGSIVQVIACVVLTLCGDPHWLTHAARFSYPLLAPVVLVAGIADRQPFTAVQIVGAGALLIYFC